jgi:hypothetical protein
VFAVVAQTAMDPGSLDEQQLQHMVSVVTGARGFVQGYWGQDVADRSQMNAFVLFARRGDADSFAAGVRANLAGATLNVVEILADASMPGRWDASDGS